MTLGWVWAWCSTQGVAGSSWLHTIFGNVVGLGTNPSAQVLLRSTLHHYGVAGIPCLAVARALGPVLSSGLLHQLCTEPVRVCCTYAFCVHASELHTQCLG